MTQRVELPWGSSSLEVRLPDGWKVLGELRPTAMNEVPSPQDACAAALAEPVNARRLADRNLEGKRTLLVVDDHSRPTPVADFVVAVTNELDSAGADRTEILIATGVHRPSTQAEIERKLGREIVSRFPVHVHDAYDASGLADVGSTSRGTRVRVNKLVIDADLIVCVGAIEPHLLLGFGGGLKMLVPGCAGAETVGHNHMQGVDPDHFDYVGERGDRSPMRLDLEEAAGMLEKDVFIVNAAMNHEARPAAFFCGHPVDAHRRGEEFTECHAGVEVEEEADVTLSNSFPMDADLRQSAKCLGNTLFSCKPGGALLGCVKCDNGLGEMPLAKTTLPYPVMRTLLKAIGKKRVLGLVKKAKKDEPIEELFLGHFGLQMMRRNHLGMFSDSPALPPDIGRKMGLARSFTRTDAMIEWAGSNAPKNATVWVWPYGGSTYARPSNKA